MKNLMLIFHFFVFAPQRRKERKGLFSLNASAMAVLRAAFIFFFASSAPLR